jgi:hypothetical protein
LAFSLSFVSIRKEDITGTLKDSTYLSRLLSLREFYNSNLDLYVNSKLEYEKASKMAIIKTLLESSYFDVPNDLLISIESVINDDFYGSN